MLLSPEVIDAWRAQNGGWLIKETSLKKTFEMKNFAEALAFVNKIGELAERMDHHPDILLHGWNKVMVTLSTHSEGGITQKDIELAEQIDKLVAT